MADVCAYVRILIIPLYILPWSAGAAHAGLFPFASEIEHFPGQPLEARCALNLELGGRGREATDLDYGGRLVLVAPAADAAFPLHVGKKTIKVCSYLIYFRRLRKYADTHADELSI